MNLSELARKGAEARINELITEINDLRTYLAQGEAPPDDRTVIEPGVPPIVGRELRGGNGHAATAHDRPRRTMSPEARKKIGKRMKKYWQERRVEEARAKH